MNNSKNELITLAILNYILIYKLDDKSLRIDYFLKRLTELYKQNLFSEELLFDFINNRLSSFIENPNLSFDFLFELCTKVSSDALKLEILQFLVTKKLNLTGKQVNQCLDIVKLNLKQVQSYAKNNIKTIHQIIDYIFKYYHQSQVNDISKDNIDLMWKQLDSFINTSFKYQVDYSLKSGDTGSWTIHNSIT